MERDTERERVWQAWEEVGREIAPALDAASAVVVIGDDPVAAAEVALGAGRVQGARRRVAIGDLVGEVEPLQALVTGDDPHGLVDSFLYGVSLNKIARPAVGFRNLYILPSGTEPVVAEEIFRNERWRRLAIGFSEVGALLLLVARADAPGVDALIGQLDGALVVDGATHVPEGVRVLAVAHAPAAMLTATTSEAVTAAEPIAPITPIESEPAHEVHTVPAATPAAEVAVPIVAAIESGAAAEAAHEASLERETAPDAATRTSSDTEEVGDAGLATDAAAAADATDESTEPRDARWIRRVVAAPPTQVHISTQQPGAERGAAAGASEWWRTGRARWILPIAAVLVVAVGIGALLTRSNNAGTRTEAGRRAAGGAPSRVAATPPVVAPNESAAPVATPASAAASGDVASAPTNPPAGAAPAGAATTAATPSSTRALTVTNPADSSKATAYAVQIVAANTLEGAKAKQRDAAWGLPAAVVSPMALDGTRWFRLTVGAFPTRDAASAFAADLRRRRKLDVDPSNVVSVPYAMLLEDRVPRARAAARVAAFVSRGLPAYALLQPDGTARVYAGAFETPAQASLMASALTVADITPVVVFRTGRAL